MKKIQKSVMVLVFLIAVCMNAPPAEADVIYSTAGTTDPYVPGGWGQITFWPPNWDFARAIAFTPTDNYSLTSIEIGLGYESGVNMADVWLMNDDSGSPGTTIESWQTTMPSYNPTNQPPTMPLIQLNSSLQPTLQAGVQYWVGASSVNTLGTLEYNTAFWVLTTSFSSYTPAHIDFLHDSSWIVLPDYNSLPGALRVNGTASGIIPEPTSLLLLGTGMAILWLGKNRHRKK